jgi:hypothetical protein
MFGWYQKFSFLNSKGGVCLVFKKYFKPGFSKNSREFLGSTGESSDLETQCHPPLGILEGK